MGNSHIDYTMRATVSPQSCHTVHAVVSTNAANCSHSFTTWFAQYRHTVRTLRGGVRGQSPWPAFIVAPAAINIVGHYVCEHGAP